MQRVAAIDIGTSSIQLLVAQVEETKITPIHQDVVITRLGQGGINGSVLLSEAMERTGIAVAGAHQRAKNLGAQCIRSFGTSALREASNKDQFCQLIKDKTGSYPEVLSGDQEAHLTYLGAVKALGLRDLALVIDVGGGSTEIVFGSGTEIISASSVKIGAVRSLETFLFTDPPSEIEWKRMLDAIWPQLENNIKFAKEKVRQVVGVGGTATTVAAMLQGLVNYDSNRVHGYIVRHRDLTDLVHTIRHLPLADRRSLAGLMPERADIFPAGAAVLDQALSILDFPTLMVSDADLLLGYIYEWLSTKGCGCYGG